MKKVLILSVLFLSLIKSGYTQCPFDNTFYIDLTPSGPGATAIETCAWGGDLVTVNVIAGETYQISTCNSNISIFSGDSEITLYDASGITILGYDDDFCAPLSKIGYLATYTGVLNVLIDEYPCIDATNCFVLEVTRAAGPAICSGLTTPICSQSGFNYTAGVTGVDAVVTEPGNDWDCLTSAPDATFYYMQIENAGDINMTLTGTLDDVDFIIWGPFSDLSAANNACGMWGTGGVNGSVVDCSFDASAIEFPEILGATAGDVYILVISNFAGVPQNVTLEQIGGTGGTDCTILCQADAGSANILVNGVPTSSPVNLIYDDCIEIISNNDFVLPSPLVGEVSELMYAIYTCTPTGNIPDVDPCFSGIYWVNQNFSDCNNSGSIILGAGIGPDLYLVPITMDDSDDNGNPNGVINYDSNGDGCFALGTPIHIYFEPPPSTLVAQIGATTYPTLQAALDAAATGAEIILLQNIAESNLVITNSIKLNAGSFTLIASGMTIPTGKYMRWLTNTLTVPTGFTITNNGTLWNNGTIIHTDSYTNTGTYKGTGTFNGNFTNNGNVTPGD